MSEKKLYETTFIINAAFDDNDIDNIIQKVLNQITNNGGTIIETNKWGRRRLAYPINKKQNGYYVHTVFRSLPEFIPQLERYLTLDDTVLRHLTLVLSEKLLEYRKQHALESGKELTLAVEEEIEEVENVEEVVSEPDIESINKKADTKSQQQEELNTEKVDATNNSDN
ncbi:MAG TPA: 30S ribosomal protein S6 [Candidatus Kapabacteria bacterium]|jgi:small subunit ribosomal protein S6|nr:30S ribosomal protein S6 [Candidatus Kapabacteria bacterium]